MESLRKVFLAGHPYVHNIRMDPKAHWEDVYSRKRPDEVSWFQAHPEVSLAMIEAAGLSPADPVVDIGGGASRLVDSLLEQGYQNLTVLDISANSLRHAKERLGSVGQPVQWVEADILQFQPNKKYLLWHDRAVFHFLTDAKDRGKYLEVMGRSVAPGGHVMIATFSLDGPEKCSGLPVQRYSHQTLQQTLGASYRLVRSDQEIHRTPGGNLQKFIYGLFQNI